MINLNEMASVVYNNTEVDFVEYKGEIVWRKYPEWVLALGTPIKGLESDGNQYIDTGYILQYSSGKSKVVIKSVNTLGNTTQGVFGFIERSGDLANRVACGKTSLGWFVGCGNTIYIKEDVILDELVVIEWDRKNQIVNINGTELPAVPSLTSGNVYTSYLFSRNNKSFPDAPYNFTGIIYSYQEFNDSNELALNLIPFKTNEGELGMLDLISKTFLTNIGTGTFTEIV